MNKGITILIDSSGSMDGEPLCRAHQMVCDIIFSYHNLMQKSLWVCKDWIHMILYNSNFNEVISHHELAYIRKEKPRGIDLTMGMIQPPFFEFRGHGPKCLGKAIEYVVNGYHGDILLIITKGTPSDVFCFNSLIGKCQIAYKKILVLHGNFAKKVAYEKLTKNIYPWDSFDSDEIVRNMFDMDNTLKRKVLENPPRIIELTI